MTILTPIVVAQESKTHLIGGRSSKQLQQIEAEALLDSLIIDSIIIDNRDIYNTSEKRYNNFLFRSANRLHYTTRRSVVSREVLLQTNDRFYYELADETARNLRSRLHLFDAWVEVEVLGNGHLLVRIVTIDQWSFSTGVAIGRDGNETRYRLQIREWNFLGNNQLLSLDYHIETDRDDYTVLQFQESRILGNPYLISWSYGNDQLNGFNSIVFGRPFYNLTQRSSYSANVSFLSGRRDRYDDGDLVATSDYEGERVRLVAARRYGSYKNKLRINVDYKYLFEETSDRRFRDGSSNLIFAEDSTYHQFGVGLRISRLDFVKLERIDGYGFTEDFTMGITGGLSFFRAFDPDFKEVVFNRVDFTIAHGAYFSGNWVSFVLANSGWLSEGKSLRQSTVVSTRFYNHSLRFVTLALRGAFTADWHRDGSEDLVLGGTNGLRGYDRFSRTGNRRVIFNLESRFHTPLQLLSTRIGTVIFVDAGRTWKASDNLIVEDLLFSVGIGIRLYLEKFSSNNILRLDFAYSDETSWEISVGTNQYFSARSGSFRLTDL